MPAVKMKGGRTRHYPYTKSGEAAAKRMAKKTGGKVVNKKKRNGKY